MIKDNRRGPNSPTNGPQNLNQLRERPGQQVPTKAPHKGTPVIKNTRLLATEPADATGNAHQLEKARVGKCLPSDKKPKAGIRARFVYPEDASGRAPEPLDVLVDRKQIEMLRRARGWKSASSFAPKGAVALRKACHEASKEAHRRTCPEFRRAWPNERAPPFVAVCLNPLMTCHSCPTGRPLSTGTLCRPALRLPHRVMT